MSSLTERDALVEIQRIATLLLKTTQSKQTTPSPLPSSIAIPPLNLINSADILAPIHQLDVSESLRQQILLYMNRRVAELQSQYTTAYQKACHATFKASFNYDLTSVRRVYETRFRNRCVPMLEGLISQIETQVGELNERNVSYGKTKRPFNNDYIPILEKYFEFNGYPSVAHRSVLATKSMMTPRQIEVWFQNHRNRAKKEGKSIRRLDSDIPLQRALSLLPSQMACNPKHPLTPPYDDSTNEPSKTSLTHDSNRKCEPAFSNFNASISVSILDDSSDGRPPHAFPATNRSSYPDPFPNSDGVFTLPAPAWRRKPATVPIVETSVDMDEFSRIFHLKLNFSENSRRRGLTPPRSETPPQPWFAATTTFAVSVPLPALVRPVTLHLSTQSPPFPPTTPEPMFGASSLVPQIIPPLSAGHARRKIRSLPRRKPTQSQSNSFGSRTSSFSSDTSSRSRISSSSSNYSSSPELSTPPPLPTLDLPVLYGEALQEPLFPLSHTDLNPNADFPLSDFLRSNSSLAPTYPSSKVIDIPFFDIGFPDFSHNLGGLS